LLSTQNQASGAPLTRIKKLDIKRESFSLELKTKEAHIKGMKEAVMTKSKKVNRPTKTTTARANKVRQKRRTYHAQLGQPTQRTTTR